MRVEHRPVRLPARLVRRQRRYFPAELADLRAPLEHRYTACLGGRAAHRQPMFDVALPIEIGGHLGQAAKAQLALAPLALAQIAPKRVDASAYDGEIRQEYRK